MVNSHLPIKTDLKAGQSMLQTLAKNWLVWAILLLGGLAPITLEAHEFRLTAASDQTKENPCPLCGQPWRQRVQPELAIPDKLPTPKNQLWVRKLRLALDMEKLARAQFEADQKKFGVSHPYLYALPEIDQHIAWINKLFSAYGLPTRGETSPVKAPTTLLQTLRHARNLEVDLASQYAWLLKHAEDKTTKRVLNTILTQTNINIDLFQNDIRIIEIEGSMVPSLL